MLGKKDKQDKNKEQDKETAAQGDEMPRDADFSKLEEAAPASGDGGSEAEQLRAELAEMKDKYLRALADFENYKKRAIRERSDLLKYEGARIIAELLAVFDNLSLALAHGNSEPEKLRTGLEMIHKLFLDTLQRFDVRPEPGMGKKFDPAVHQALSQVPVKDTEAGIIISELKQAFYYKDKLIRPGEVVVAAASSEEEKSEQADRE